MITLPIEQRYSIYGIDEFWDHIKNPEKPLLNVAMMLSIRPVHDPAAVPVLADHGYKAEQLFFVYPDLFDARLTSSACLADIQQVIDASRRLGPVIKHFQCKAGKARSAANLAACMTDELGSGSEREVFAIINHMRPISTPNPLIIALADIALGRDGRLMEALLANVDMARRYPDYVERIENQMDDYYKNKPEVAAWLLEKDETRLEPLRRAPAYAGFCEWQRRYAPKALA